jgi:hypothetical protein
MLRIFINNQQVPLPDDISITVKRESAFFSEDTITGDFAINISIVKDDFTSRLLGYFDRLSAVSTEQKNTGRIEWSGVVLLNGEAKLEESSGNKTYEGYIKGSIGVFGNAIKDKTIKDYLYGDTREINDLDKASTFPDIDWTCFPLTNSKFFEGRFPADEDGAEAPINAQVNKFVNGNIVKDPLDSYCVVSPFPFLAYVVEQIFIEEGFTIAHNDLREDALLKKLVLYTNWNIKRVEKILTIVGIGFVSLDPAYIIDSFNISDLLPKEEVKKFILGIRQDLNIDFFIENKTVRIILKDKILLNPNYNDLTSKVVGKRPVDRKKEIEGYVFTPSMNSDDTEFENWVDLSLHKGTIGDPVDTVEDLPAWATGSIWTHNLEIQVKVDEIRFVRSESVWYKWIVNDNEETKFLLPYVWEKESVNYQPAKYGNQADAKKMESYFAPIFAKSADVEPNLSIRGTGALWEEENNTKPSLLIYEGKKNNVPFGTSWIQELALDYDSENNILDKYHRETIDFTLNRSANVSYEADLSALAFRSLDMTEKQRIKGIDHLIKSLGMTFKIKSFERCQLELVAILPPKFDHLTLAAAVPFVPPTGPDTVDPVAPVVNPEELNFSWLGGKLNFDITTTETWTLVVSDSWIEPPILSGVGNKMIRVRVLRRDDGGEPRLGYIDIRTHSGGKGTIFIEQAAFGLDR